MTRLYFDYNATTPCHPDAIKAWTHAIKLYGNPSSLHHEGRLAKDALEQARDTVAHSIHAKGEQIVFTSSATEANNHIFSAITDQHGPENTHIITCSTEHASIRSTCDHLQARGASITLCPVDDHGHIDLQAVAAAIQPHTRLLSVMMVNNETGVIQPIDALSALAHNHGVLFHTDAVQALGKLPVDVTASQVDFLSLSSHKCYGPKGVGALYVADSTHLQPFIHGGGQEKGLRSGTENIPNIVAMAAAFKSINHDSELPSRLADLKQQLWGQLDHAIPHLQLNGALHDTVCNTLNVSVADCDGHALAINLDLEGIAVSTGSACSTGSIEPSPILLAMGYDIHRVKSAIRFSLGRLNTDEEISNAIPIIKQTIERLRSA